MNHETPSALSKGKVIKWIFLLPPLGFAIGIFACGVCSSPLIWRSAEVRGNRAKMDIKSIEHACTSYFAKEGSWPDSLEVFIKPDPKANRPAVLTERSLIDPWGRPYQYDPRKLHPKIEKPLIWTEGEQPGKAGSRITNWDYVDGGT